jgi:lipoate-protein ligase A
MNMAVDECLLESAANGVTTLRVYAWSEPTLSIGYFQATRERVQFEPLKKLPVVRRASGGGAILHHHEVTYSFATPNAPLGRSEQIYRDFHETLIEALSSFGVAVQIFDMQSKSEETQPSPFLCFQRRSPFDLVIGQHKVVGSAQRKSKSALIQHGSLLLRASPHTPDLPGICDLGACDTFCDTFPPSEIDHRELIQAWLPLLENRLGLSFPIAQLTDFEQRHAAAIATDKFASPDWLNKR